MVVEIETMAFIRCSTTISVTPRALTARSSSSASSTSVALRPAITSSSSSTSGSSASALATSSRLRSGMVRSLAGSLGDARQADDLEQLCARSNEARVERFAPCVAVHRADRDVLAHGKLANGLTIWNVRAMPRRHTAWVGTSAIRRPPYVTAPVVGL